LDLYKGVLNVYRQRASVRNDNELPHALVRGVFKIARKTWPACFSSLNLFKFIDIELAFTYVCIASCNLSAYTFVTRKIKLLTDLLNI